MQTSDRRFIRSVAGTVAREESNSGIGGLLVTLYDVTSDNEPGTSHGPDHIHNKRAWVRIASVLTAGDGSFAFTYGPDDLACSSRSFDIAIVVSAPERGCSGDTEDDGRIATCVRRRAGRVETFIVLADEDQLRKAGFRKWKEHDVEQVIARRQEAAKRRAALHDDSRRIVARRLEQGWELDRKAEEIVAPLILTLSGIPPEKDNLTGTRHVPRGGSVLAYNKRSVTAGVQAFREASVSIDVPVAQIPTVAEQYKLPAHAHLPTWSRRPSGSLCSEEAGPVDDCIRLLQGKEIEAGNDTPETVAPEPDDTPAGLLAATDLPQFINRLAQDLTSPESALVVGANGQLSGTPKTRADAGEIDSSVTGLKLHSGPADVPSLYDFHRLRVAFDDVWLELFDDKLRQTAKDLYKRWVNLGGSEPSTEVICNYIKSAGNILKEAQQEVDPPFVVASVFQITPQQWETLQSISSGSGSLSFGDELEERAKRVSERKVNDKDVFQWVGEYAPQPEPLDASNVKSWIQAVQRSSQEFTALLSAARTEGERLIAYADYKLNASQTFSQFHSLLGELERATKEPYRFSIFAATPVARSVNFGIVTTFRQRWEPLAYQVGSLVKTIPLAPKEIRRYSKRTSVKTSRAEREVRNHLQSRKTDSSETSKVEKEIVEKAMQKTNFQMTAQGGVNLGIWNVGGAHSGSQDAATESAEAKKEFREAVFKAAEEYRSERTVEINTTTADEATAEESGEISNPNDEITVTYLFYELQRRFRVSENLYRVTPVVLVAQEFPTPDQIDDDWIMAHDWILRRVILDDSFIPAMNYLATKVVGDDVALQELFMNVQQQRRVLNELKEELVSIREQTGRRYAALQRSIENRAAAMDEEAASGALTDAQEFFFGGEGVSPEALQVREEAARDAYEREAKLERELQARLERESTALASVSESYAKSLSEHLNRKAQISRLRVHIKQNIMHYMQAIWSHEPPDQRFFRLHDVAVPQLSGDLDFSLTTDPDSVPIPPDWKKPQKLKVTCGNLDFPDQWKPLAEVADLDNLLGFKGNYMIFPLKEQNVLTTFMMLPYFDDHLGLRDPDMLGNWTLSDFTRYVCCLRRELSKDEFDRRLPGLMVVYQRIVSSPLPDGQEIVVPTKSLYIEALPGVHPVLEDFKLAHRGVDVKKAQAEVRSMEFDNLRLAARLFAGEREDPTVEKKVIFEGTQVPVVPPDDDD